MRRFHLSRYLRTVGPLFSAQKVPQRLVHHCDHKYTRVTLRYCSNSTITCHEAKLSQTSPDTQTTRTCPVLIDQLQNFLDNNNDKEFLTRLEAQKTQLSLDELSQCLLALSKVTPDSPTFRSLVYHTMERARDQATVNLGTLARLSQLLNVLRDVPYSYTYPILVPKIEKHLRGGDLNEEGVFHTTVALKHFIKYLSTDLMDLYRNQLQPNHQFPNDRLVTICNLLNSSAWALENTPLIKRLLSQVDVAQLANQDLSVVLKVVQGQLEPRPLFEDIMRRSKELAEDLHTLNPVLLQCQVTKTLPEVRRQLVDDLESYLRQLGGDPMSTDDVLVIFKILRQAKVSQWRLCNLFWSRVLAKIKAEPEEQGSDRLVHHCHRYMYFNNNLGGTYRHRQFEIYATELIMREMREGVSKWIPSRMARLSSFLIGYGTTDGFPQLILDQLLSMRDQLSFGDCLQLSRGIQIALELRFKRGLPHEAARQLQLLENALDEVLRRRLTEERRTLSITDANVIMRSLTMRKSVRSGRLLRRIAQRYETVDFPITSRLIRDTTMNLSLSRIKTPQLLEAFLAYVARERDSMTGDIAKSVLHACYSIGHETGNYEALRAAAEVVQRDFEQMTGLAVVNSCLALCYYGCLPRELMARVFCIEFIKRLEDEIRMCYSKATYPQKVLNRVMQLNRSVCLDYPEYNVPWFQQNYVEAQATQSAPNELFQKDVLHKLKRIFGAEAQKIELNHSTPYGYRLDFLLRIGDNGRLVSGEAARRLAVVLLGTSSFCANDPQALCGYEQLRRRHLEILGFEVLEISYREWTKMDVETLQRIIEQREVIMDN